MYMYIAHTHIIICIRNTYIYVSFLQPKTNNGAYNLVYSFTYSNSINT